MTLIWVRAGVAAVSVGLCVATLVQREWIELVFRVHPDGGHGSLEWLVVVATAAASALFAALTAIEWCRLRLASTLA